MRSSPFIDAKGHDAGIRDLLGSPLSHEDLRTWLDDGFAGLVKHVQWQTLYILLDSFQEFPAGLRERSGEQERSRETRVPQR